MEKLTLSVAEAAELLGICPNGVYKRARQKDFPAFKIDGRLLISRKGLEKWVEDQAEKGTNDE